MEVLQTMRTDRIQKQATVWYPVYRRTGVTTADISRTSHI